MASIKIIIIPLLYFIASLFFYQKSKEKFNEVNYLVILLGINNERKWQKYNQSISKKSLKVGVILLLATILLNNLINLKNFTNILILIQIFPYFVLAYLSIKNMDE